MHGLKRMGLLLLTLVISAPSLAASGHADEVDPRIGTGGDGHTFPGATVPSGMIQLSPATAATTPRAMRGSTRGMCRRTWLA